MKLHPDNPDVFTITGYGPGWIGLNGEKITRSVVIGSRGERVEWRCDSFSDLTPAHFDQLAELGAAVAGACGAAVGACAPTQADRAKMPAAVANVKRFIA